MLLSPSILAADFANLERDIRKAADCGADYIHVDVMDGQFVPNLTIGIPVVAALRKVTDLPLDVHLMIDRPVRYVERFCDAGANYLTIHAEADTVAHNLDALDLIRRKGVHPAVSLKPGTGPEALDPYWDKVDLILIMTVEPGFGGQAFMENQMEKLSAISQAAKHRGRPLELEVDGGVNRTTAKLCAAAGATVVVAGNAFFHTADPAALVQEIHTLGGTSPQ